MIHLTLCSLVAYLSFVFFFWGVFFFSIRKSKMHRFSFVLRLSDFSLTNVSEACCSGFYSVLYISWWIAFVVDL